MPFANYKSIGEVAQAYRIVLRPEDFVVPVPFAVSESFRADLHFAQEHVAYTTSESAVCENLIYPMLREVWKHHTDALTVWSHLELNYDENLNGIPDYFVARKSPLGHWVMDKPYMVVIEAKRDDFFKGWAQCLAAMLAARGLNGQPGRPVYGITTNGRGWEFGKLYESTMIQDTRLYTLSDLDQLCAAVNCVFDQCRRQLADPSQAA